VSEKKRTFGCQKTVSVLADRDTGNDETVRVKVEKGRKREQVRITYGGKLN